MSEASDCEDNFELKLTETEDTEKMDTENQINNEHDESLHLNVDVSQESDQSDSEDKGSDGEDVEMKDNDEMKPGESDKEAESDSDEEIVVNRRRRSKMNASLLDDSDEEDSQPKSTQCAESDDEKSGSEDEDSQPASRKVSRLKICDDSDEEDSRLETTQHSESDDEKSGVEDNDSQPVSKKASRLKNICDDSDDTGDEGNDSCKENVPPADNGIQKSKYSDDIFDAETDDDDEDKSGKSDEESDADGPAPGQGDDEEDDGFVAPKSGRWSKGAGAARKPSERKHREKALQAQQIHSETQRMTREASVRLPYHKPKPMSLQEILNKRNQKQTTPLQLRPTTSVIRQMSLESPAPKKKHSPIPTPADTKDESPKPQEENTGLDCVDGEKVEETEKQTADPNEEDEFDQLPDLIVESVPLEKPQPEVKDTLEADVSKQRLLTTEQDSGFITTPFNSSDDDSNGLKKSHDLELEDPVPDDVDILPEIVHHGRGDADCLSQNSKGLQTVDNNKNIVKEKELDLVDGGPSSTKKIKSKLSLLADVELPALAPKLDMGAGDFIDLDIEEEAEPKTGVAGLMSRLMKHAKKVSPKGPKKVEVNYVHKVVDEKEKEVLKLSTISYEIEAEHTLDPKLQAPGAKLQLLKEQLRGGMKARREEARMKRMEAFELDNEEGFVGEEQDEEAELTDQTDTDAEEEVEEEGMEVEEEEKEVNPYGDDEAEDDDDFQDENTRLELNGSDSEHKEDEDFICFIVNPYGDDEAEDDDDFQDEENMRLELNGSDSEHEDDEDMVDGEERSQDFMKSAVEKPQTFNEEDQQSTLKTPKVMRSESVSSDTQKDSFAIPSSKRERIPSDKSTQDMFTPFSKASSCASLTKSSSATKLPELTLPIEETQDLYRSESSNSGLTTPKDMYHYDATQLQMLDEDGFLKVNKSAGKKYIKRHLDLGDEGSTQNNLNELMGLCSGKFPGGTDQDDMSELLGLCSGKFPSTLNKDQDDMNELMGLCSGKFPGMESQKPGKKKLTMKGLFSQHPISTQETEEELLGLCSGKFANSAKVPSDTQGCMDELMGLCSGQFPSAQSQKQFSTIVNDTQSNIEELLGLCSGKFPSCDSEEKFSDLKVATQVNMEELLGLCSGKFPDPATQSQKFSNILTDTQSNMDELLELCSGRFPSEDAKEKKQLSCLISDTQTNMEELLALCSGQFPSTQMKSQTQNCDVLTDEEEIISDSQKRQTVNEDSQDSLKMVTKDSRKKKLSLLSDDEDDDDDDDVDMNLQILSDDEESGSQTKVTPLDSDEEAGNEGEENDVEFEDPEDDELALFNGFTDKKGKLRREFVEAEAELSGSEYDSDENLDLDEKDDILELEEGDKDDVGTEEELRNQVNRVHMKSVIDQDKKEIRMYQEMYLPDGDLYSEGQGRQRKFRWKNVDDDTQQDMFDNNSDEEQNPDEDAEQESKWRMERFARERWLEEQKAQAENEDEDAEDSHFLKFGTTVLKKMKGGIAVERPQPACASQPTETKQTTPKSLFKLKQRRGSFLTRSKETLAVIAERTKPVSNPVVPVNSRNFVFSALSPEEKAKKAKAMAVKRANSVTDSQPLAKRPKLERSNTFSGNSIFKLMDH